MRKILFQIVLIVTVSCLQILDIQAQSKVERDSVEIGLRAQIYQNNRRLTMRGIENLFRFDEEATEAFKRAKLNFQFSQGAFILGAALIITPLAVSLTDNDPLWGMAGVGAAAIGAGLIMNEAKKRWLLESVRIYHENLANSGAYLEGGNTFGLTYALKLK